jgi:hypothetical protein
VDWLTSIPAPFFLQGGAVALLSVFIIAILTGRLVPRSTYEDKIKEADDWKTAWRDSEKAREELSKNVHVALELGRITEKLMIASSVAPEKENGEEH